MFCKAPVAGDPAPAFLRWNPAPAWPPPSGVRAEPGLRLGFLSAGGWDTHANQGQVVGQLASGNLHEGRELPVRNDYRAVLAQVLRARQGLAPDTLDELFPGYASDRSLDGMFKTWTRRTRRRQPAADSRVSVALSRAARHALAFPVHVVADAAIATMAVEHAR